MVDSALAYSLRAKKEIFHLLLQLHVGTFGFENSLFKESVVVHVYVQQFDPLLLSAQNQAILIEALQY